MNSCKISGSKFLILEALELQKGEINFISHNNDSLRKLFQRLAESNYLEINDAIPFSFHGIPLLEMIITINSDKPEILDVSDIKRALLELANQIESSIARNIVERNLNSHSLAFLVHDLANARGYLKLLNDQEILH